MADAQHSAGTAPPGVRPFIQSISVSASGDLAKVTLELPLSILQEIVDAARGVVRVRKEKKTTSKRILKVMQREQKERNAKHLALGRELEALIAGHKATGLNEIAAVQKISEARGMSQFNVKLFIRLWRRHVFKERNDDVMNLSKISFLSNEIAKKTGVHVTTIRKIIRSAANAQS